MEKNQKKIRLLGFTMIELLVVIAVIGVLAVAVLSSIDPLEQINKGKDTKKRSDSAQILNAIDRYYASQQEYPFAIDSTTADGNLHIINTEMTDMLKYLTDTREIKSSFKTRLLGDKGYENYLYLYINPQGAKNSGDVLGIYTCFQPSSYSFRQEALKHASDWPWLASYPNKYYICLP